jgi:isopenicillin-N epimerase
MLHVRRDRRERIRPAIVSHGRDAVRTSRSRFQLEFDWTGTTDPSAVLSVPAALSFLASALPGGMEGVYARNHALALDARRIIADALSLALPCPDHMVGFMAALILPPAPRMKPSEGGFVYELQDRLVDEFGIQVPIMPWPRTPHRLVRISAQLYNELPQYERLAQALVSLLG